MLIQVGNSVYFRVIVAETPHLAAPGAPPDTSFSESAIWYFNEATNQLTRS